MNTKKRGAPEPPDFCVFRGGWPADRRRAAAHRGEPRGELADLEDLDEAEGVVSPALIIALALRRFRHADWPYFKGETQWPLHDHGLMLAHGIIRTRLEASNYDFPTRLASCIAVSRRGWIFPIRASMAGWFSIIGILRRCRFKTLRLRAVQRERGKIPQRRQQGCNGRRSFGDAAGSCVGAEVDGEFAINSRPPRGAVQCERGAVLPIGPSHRAGICRYRWRGFPAFTGETALPHRRRVSCSPRADRCCLRTR